MSALTHTINPNKAPPPAQALFCPCRPRHASGTGKAAPARRASPPTPAPDAQGGRRASGPIAASLGSRYGAIQETRPANTFPAPPLRTGENVIGIVPRKDVQGIPLKLEFYVNGVLLDDTGGLYMNNRTVNAFDGALAAQ